MSPRVVNVGSGECAGMFLQGQNVREERKGAPVLCPVPCGLNPFVAGSTGQGGSCRCWQIKPRALGLAWPPPKKSRFVS
jgi:hypothetical protein